MRFGHGNEQWRSAPGVSGFAEFILAFEEKWEFPDPPIFTLNLDEDWEFPPSPTFNISFDEDWES